MKKGNLKMKGKYDTLQLIGVPLITDDSGQYQLKLDNNGEYKAHDWRIGKHTKGKFKKLGQVFITENNMLVAIVETKELAFKNRHDFTPMQRFTNEFISDDLLSHIKKGR